ncbi:thioredoxin C-1-like [Teleopsis dalmanni]|uniref:thioredoxin C-1-like n=1 Tax=Teleopsis dalmanni TaxID=139649 RepID=UPI000D32AD32|nr:thioredoxin C-1-like [Teleopsis dalmanni]XP_037934841.1 thioredoxin C-1-like [Teleopsis dalmanni]XP_037934842.1 thioredoxin C-1-like [Teleopsis dalmanni]
MFSAKLRPILEVVRRANIVRRISLSSINREIFLVKTMEDFDKKVKKNEKIVIVDFFATWCNPCKMLTPRIEAIIDEMAGDVELAKVDIDEHSELALDYDIGTVPVLLVMKNGKVINRMVGLQDKDKLRAWIDQNIADTK